MTLIYVKGYCGNTYVLVLWQAASEYQAALTAIDRVLRTQVLALTSDEPTRQRFFHLQQEVFYTRWAD